MLVFDEYFQGYDSSYNLMFHGQWSEWEEDGWMFIFYKDNHYYLIEGGHCVMIPKQYSSVFPRDLYEISEEEALEEMFNWSQYEQEIGTVC